MSPRLIIVSGKTKGSEFDLSEPETGIGRDKANRVCINDASVSRRHCRIEANGEGYLIRDLESFNGTFVNGERIGERKLNHGDQINIGDISLFFLTKETESEKIFAGGKTVVFGENPSNLNSTVRLARRDVVYLKPEKIVSELPELARTARDLSVLLKISTALSTIRESRELEENLLMLIAEIIPAQRAAVLLFDENGEQVVSDFVWSKDADDGELQISRTVVENCLGEQESVLSSNIGEDENLNEAESLIAFNIHSVLCVPLVFHGKTLGVIYLDTTDKTEVFDRHHLELLTGIAGIAAAPLENAKRYERLAAEKENLRRQIESNYEIIGESRKMREVFDLIARIAPTDSTVLVTGESGTGKELAASAIHRNSRRKDAAFVVVNCAALPETLLESELFGHEKGAFTGTAGQKKGLFELADGGTIFLDEIGELPASMQAKLLRVLQNKEIRRVGGEKTLRIDVRVVAATNKNLEEEVETGNFREDLFYRLNVINLEMPPLREHADDIPLLIRFFIERYNRECNRHIKDIAPDARRRLLEYKWAGNIRELENVIERAVILASGDVITLKDLPPNLTSARRGADGGRLPFKEAVREAKKHIVETAIDSSGSITEAAKILDIHPNNLHRLINQLDLREKYDDEK